MYVYIAIIAKIKNTVSVNFKVRLENAKNRKDTC